MASRRQGGKGLAGKGLAGKGLAGAPPLYDRIGAGYDTQRQPDERLAAPVREALGDKAYGAVLELACGSGNYGRMIAPRALLLAGLDVSATMLDQARAKGRYDALVQASAEWLPFRDKAFDACFCVLGIHHFNNLNTVFGDVARVLRTGGAFAAFTVTREQQAGYWLRHYFPRMMAEADAHTPSRADQDKALKRAGFRTIEWRPWWTPRPGEGEPLRDRILMASKHEPRRLMDPAVRNASSVFAQYAEEAELEHGLDMLWTDILTGRWETVAARYDDRLGDHAVVLAQ